MGFNWFKQVLANQFQDCFKSNIFVIQRIITFIFFFYQFHWQKNWACEAWEKRFLKNLIPITRYIRNSYKPMCILRLIPLNIILMILSSVISPIKLYVMTKNVVIVRATPRRTVMPFRRKNKMAAWKLVRFRSRFLKISFANAALLWAIYIKNSWEIVHGK